MRILILIGRRDEVNTNFPQRSVNALTPRIVLASVELFGDYSLQYLLVFLDIVIWSVLT
jgi:hypothetical protein